jgi:hypothetical protein
MKPYLLGYRNGCNDYSWDVGLFFNDELPVDVKLSRAEVMKQYSPKLFGPKTIEACDYYIVRLFGVQSIENYDE